MIILSFCIIELISSEHWRIQKKIVWVSTIPGEGKILTTEIIIHLSINPFRSWIFHGGGSGGRDFRASCPQAPQLRHCIQYGGKIVTLINMSVNCHDPRHGRAS